MKEIQIKGDIIPNEMKWVYDYFEFDSTCPLDVENVINELNENEELRIVVNSGGGSVYAGQEIYSKIKKCRNTVTIIESLAGSAAGVIAMAAKKVQMTPVSMIMIHNVSMSGCRGDYHEHQKAADSLKEMNKALAAAYTEKSGMDLKDVLKMMDKETWLTAERAKEAGFCDEIITDSPYITNDAFGMRVTKEMVEEAKAEKEKKNRSEKEKQEILGDLYLYGI